MDAAVITGLAGAAGTVLSGVVTHMVGKRGRIAAEKATEAAADRDSAEALNQLAATVAKLSITANDQAAQIATLKHENATMAANVRSAEARASAAEARASAAESRAAAAGEEATRLRIEVADWRAHSQHPDLG